MRTAIITILAAIFLGAGGTFLWLYYGGFEGEQATAVAFIDTYGDYAEVADQVESLVHLPGIENNNNRQELLDLLNAMLTQDMTATRRESLARLAYTNLDAIKKEIDAAQAAQAQLYIVLQDLDNASRVFRGIELRHQASDIVAMARKRAELTAHLTSVLSKTNDQTYAIITRILADNGELTQAHIQEINDATTKAEDRFDTLTELYKELIDLKQQIDESFTAFAVTAI